MYPYFYLVYVVLRPKPDSYFQAWHLQKFVQTIMITEQVIPLGLALAYFLCFAFCH